MDRPPHGFKATGPHPFPLLAILHPIPLLHHHEQSRASCRSVSAENARLASLGPVPCGGCYHRPRPPLLSILAPSSSSSLNLALRQILLFVGTPELPLPYRVRRGRPRHCRRLGARRHDLQPPPGLPMTSNFISDAHTRCSHTLGELSVRSIISGPPGVLYASWGRRETEAIGSQINGPA